MPGESQEDIQLRTVPFDWHMSATSSISVNLGILSVPHGKNMQLELLSVGFTNRIAVTAATVDLEWRDALVTGAGLATVANSFVPTNVTTDRVFDCDSVTLAEMADVLGTLILDLQTGLPLPSYTITNLTRALAYNCNEDTDALLADQIGQIIVDVLDQRLVDVVFTNPVTPPDRQFDANSTTRLELADIVQILHDDLTPTADLVAGVNLASQGIEGYVSMWEGSLVLDQGDAVNLEFSVTNISAPGEGYAAIVEHRVLRHAGG